MDHIEHTDTRIKGTETNGICRGGRRALFRMVDELQRDLDVWIIEYNEQRRHQDRWCYGKTSMQTLLDAASVAQEKQTSTEGQAH